MELLLTLLHSEQHKLCGVSAVLSAIGLKERNIFSRESYISKERICSLVETFLSFLEIVTLEKGG